MALPSLHTLTYYTQRQTLNHASLPQRDGPAGMGAAPTFTFSGGEASAQKYIRRRAFPIPTPAQKYIRRGRTLPYPNLWASAVPLPWVSSGAIAHPPLSGSSGAKAHPLLGETMGP